MPIKNYTTKIDIYTSLGEIQGALARAGATKIMVDYLDGGKPDAVTFGVKSPTGNMAGFKLTARTDGVMRAFARDKIKTDREQAERTAWRNIRDWVMAQMALIESEQAELDEMFLQNLIDGSGRTLHETYKSGQLLIGDGGGQA